MHHPFLEKLKTRARSMRQRIVFAEGDDERVIEAAHRLKQEGLADPILISKNSVAGLVSIDSSSSPRLGDYAALYHQLRASKGVTESEAGRVARQPLYFAALMVA